MTHGEHGDADERGNREQDREDQEHDRLDHSRQHAERDGDEHEEQEEPTHRTYPTTASEKRMILRARATGCCTGRSCTPRIHANVTGRPSEASRATASPRRFASTNSRSAGSSDLAAIASTG